MNNLNESHKTVFLAEDNIALANVWERALSRDGFTVQKASNGTDALKKILDGNIPIIFSDMNMPGLNGMDLLESLKKQDDRHYCVNIITGNASLEGAVEAIRHGACDYLSKPCDNDELTAMAFRCFRHQQQFHETDELKKTITALEKVNRLKSEFVSNVSHELRTPLFAMGSALELAFGDSVAHLDEETTKLINIIRSNHSRLTEVIQNLLNFSQIEKGHFVPKRVSMNLNDLIDRIVRDLGPLTTKKSIHLIYENRADTNGEIDADPNQLQQVFINLLGNAIKFTPEGGTIKINLNQDNNATKVSIWNSGQGIPGIELDRIFDRFYQIDGSLTREVGGSGIGLSIVKAIIEMHGGQVWAESEPNAYTEFHVVLPKNIIRGDQK